MQNYQPKDFPNYFTSKYGDIFSSKRGTIKKMKGYINIYGYIRHDLRKNNKRYSKCEHRLIAENYLEIRTLDKGPVKFKLFDFQKKVLEQWTAHQFNILRKFRQGGLTTMGVLWSLWMCMFRTDKQILVMSKTDLEAIKAGKMAHSALDAIDRDHPWL